MDEYGIDLTLTEGQLNVTLNALHFYKSYLEENITYENEISYHRVAYDIIIELIDKLSDLQNE